MAEATEHQKVLAEETKVQLLQFLIAVAWSDQAVAQAEASYIRRLAQQLELRGTALARVVAGITKRPPPAALKIGEIPLAVRRRFLAEAEKLISVDGRTAPAERKVLDSLRKSIIGR